MSQAEYTIEELLANEKGLVRVIRGPEGYIAFARASRPTRCAHRREPEERHADAREAADVIAYYGWNIWNVLGTRATEGENGLIPRQEYEALSTVEYMTKFPELWDLITEEVGGDGVIDIGATARREIGTKVNALHVWCAGASFVTSAAASRWGSATSARPTAPRRSRARSSSTAGWRAACGATRAACSPRNATTACRCSKAPWLERFRDEPLLLEGPEQQAMYTKFNATAQLLVFLLHFDNRLGLGDSGPDPTEDGGF